MSANSASSSYTILFVEDDDLLRNVIAPVLISAGYRILTASNAAEALEVRARFAAPVHVLVTDVGLPGMNGEELSQRLTASEPGLRTIFTSGYADLTASYNIRSRISFLAKPFSMAALLGIVRKTLDLAVDETDSVPPLTTIVPFIDEPDSAQTGMTVAS